MSKFKMTDQDFDLLKSKKISIDQVQKQLKYFEKGFPFLTIIGSATKDLGIKTITGKDYYVEKWNKYLASNNKVIKFVPASGAATRMFKDLFEFVNSAENDLSENKNIALFIDHISKFAFYDELNQACINKYAQTAQQLVASNKIKELLLLLIGKEGLNYGNKPKGLLKFHRYEDGSVRTALEEHLAEGYLYANNGHHVNIHFTVSSEHSQSFEELIKRITAEYNQKYDIKFNISLSEQKCETDTIAVDPNNIPIRENGQLLFRPAGHGALLQNLNDLHHDVIFIKNIDNVVRDKIKIEEADYKKTLGGYLIEVQEKVFNYLTALDSSDFTDSDLSEMLSFIENELSIKNEKTKGFDSKQLAFYLKQKLNRPIRVCGMVKNTGDPGGGPFIVKDKDNSSSLQILESTEIDTSNPIAVNFFETGTHFNPVDIVCAVIDYRGNKFDLNSFSDPETGFISTKSKNGEVLKALELPGLWNGSMSDWNTVFIEVPLFTFNPVKTVTDLLRDNHQ